MRGDGVEVLNIKGTGAPVCRSAQQYRDFLFGSVAFIKVYEVTVHVLPAVRRRPRIRETVGGPYGFRIAK